MASSHIFRVPLSYGRLGGTVSGSEKHLKRKRRPLEPDSEDEEEPTEPLDTSQYPAAITSLTATQAAQYRLAGAHPSDGLPKPPFPHREHSKIKLDVVQNETGFPTKIDDERITLRQRHLGVLTTIMHHSLLNGDYRRAGRAWAMLLRSGPAAVQLGLTTMDLHRDGRWQIAAEILLRRESTRTDQFSQGPSSMLNDEELTGQSLKPIFSEANLQTVRDFYNRLIVQFPIHRSRLNTAVEFHLAMYSLWIYQVVDGAKSEHERLSRLSEASDVPIENLDSSHHSEPSGEELSAAESKEVDLEEIRGAKLIATRLEALLSSPPYDRDPQLLHLAGSVALWLADLVEDAEAESERRTAKEFFDRSLANGGRHWKARNGNSME